MAVRRMFDIRSNELDAQGNRVIEVEMPALRTHLADIQKVLHTKESFALVWSARLGDRLKTGLVSLKKRVRFQMVFKVGEDPDGAWEVTVYAGKPGGGWRRTLWKQLVFVQKKLRLSHERIDELAHRYAPVFLYSSEEKYYPVSLDALLTSEEVRSCPDDMTLKTLFGKEKVPLADLGEWLRFNGHCDYLLNFNFLNMWSSVFAKIGGDPRKSTVYYSYLEDPDSDRFYITYHLIYAFDTKTGIARKTGIGPHVFDRESMIMVFENGPRPSGMIISGHLENQTIFFLNKLKVWTQGRIRVPFYDDRTLKIGNHPVIAVAEGSHALYPTSGVYHCMLLREVAGFLDPELMREDGARENTIRPDQILSPPAMPSAGVPSYELAALGLDALTSHPDPDPVYGDGQNAFLVFSGFWVDVPGTTNARFPPFTSKISNINQWVDGAYDWDWKDVPDRYHRNNRMIFRYLIANFEDL